MAKLFGTDGIRGTANKYPLTCETAVKTGKAVGVILAREKGYDSVVIGKDPRISGDMLDSALSAGVASVGVNVLSAGVIPTPGIGYLAASIPETGAGIVVSASHNPYYDNGIKIFKKGMKISDREEERIEDHILNEKQGSSGEKTGRISIIPDSLERYSDFLLSNFPYRKLEKKIRIAIDCANGAASEIVHSVFNDRLFEPFFIHDSPDGININENCGSGHTDRLRDRVLKENADIGIAFDGDADRLIAVDEKGKKIEGDTVLAICARHAKEKDILKNNVIVSTVMSNTGLSTTLERLGIKHIRSGVGDRKVFEAMKKSGAVIGGENSGHIIFSDCHSTGDGILSALKVIEVMIETGQSLSDLASIIKIYPQVFENVEVRRETRPDFRENKSVANVIRSVEQELGDKGRVLIRYSGTRPLLRIMVEGPDRDEISQYSLKISKAFKDSIE